MRHFTARYLEAVGFGDAAFEDVILGELVVPSLTTAVVKDYAGWIASPAIAGTLVDEMVAGRASATVLTRMPLGDVGRQRQVVEKSPTSAAGVQPRMPVWLRLSVDTPFLIEDRVLKFTVSKEGTSGSGSAAVGWRVTVILHDGTEVELSGVVVIPEGENSAQVEIDFDEISLPSTNYASVGLYWSWGIPMSPSSARNRQPVVVVNEDAPFYTRSLVHQPWLYWGDMAGFTGDLTGNGRSASGTYFEAVDPALGCYGSAASGVQKHIGSSESNPNFASPLLEWSVSAVFRVNEAPSTYHKRIMGIGGLVNFMVDNNNNLRIGWYEYGATYEIAALSGFGWQHLVVTWDGDAIKVFLNGVEEMVWDQPPPEVSKDGASFLAGPPSGAGQGYIEHDDFAVWDRPLSQEDVSYIYAGLG